MDTFTKITIGAGGGAAGLCLLALLVFRRVDRGRLIGILSVAALVGFALSMIAVSLVLELQAKRQTERK